MGVVKTGEKENLHVHQKWPCTCKFCEPNFLLTKTRNTWSLTAVNCIGYMNHGCHKITQNGRDVSYTRWRIKRARTSFYFSLQISPNLSFLCEVQSQSKTCKVVRISWVISSAIYSSTLIHCHVLQIPTKVTLKRNNHLPDKSFWGQKPNSSKLDLM